MGLPRRAAVTIEKRDGRARRLVDFAEIRHPGIVWRHVIQQQIGVAENNRDVVLERVLEVGFVSHCDHQRDWRDCLESSATHAIVNWTALTIGVCLTGSKITADRAAGRFCSC